MSKLLVGFVPIFFVIWIQIQAVTSGQILGGPGKDKKEFTLEKDPLSRIRFYFEWRYDKYFGSVSSQPFHRNRWVDIEVNQFLGETKADLTNLLTAYSSLESDCANFSTTPEGLFNRNETSKLSSSLIKIQKQTKKLREKLSRVLLWSVRGGEFGFDLELDSLEDLKIAVKLLRSLFSKANEGLQIWLFPEEHQEASLVTVEGVSEEIPLVGLLKAEVVAGEIVRSLGELSETDFK